MKTNLGSAQITKMQNKVADLVGAAIVNRFKPIVAKVGALTYDRKPWAAQATLQNHFQLGAWW